jgi:hypothetical protein
MARALFAIDLFFARFDTVSSVSRASGNAGSTHFSSAAIPASLWSVFNATFSSSAGSLTRATASAAVRPSAACRATLPSAFAS